MSSPASRTGSSIDKDASITEPRLSLTRERVKDLRIQSGCRTGLLIAKNPVTVVTHGTLNRCA